MEHCEKKQKITDRTTRTWLVVTGGSPTVGEAPTFPPSDDRRLLCPDQYIPHVSSNPDRECGRLLSPTDVASAVAYDLLLSSIRLRLHTTLDKGRHLAG
jgi:hypothetical protein